MAKKILKWTSIVFLALCILAISPFILSPVKNNIVLHYYAQQLYDYPLPKNTKIITKTSDAGNLGPTSNHLDFSATMEIKSSLTEAELVEYYSSVLFKPANKVTIFGLDTSIYGNQLVHPSMNVEVIPKNSAELSYSGNFYYKTNEIDESISENLYIITIMDSDYAPGFDLRAH